EDRLADPDALLQLHREVAGGPREGRKSACRTGERGQADRRSARTGGRRGAVSSTPVVEGARALAGPVRDRRRARRKALWRRRALVLGLMSPWLVGFTVFFGYPLVSSAYLSLTHYDLLSPPRGGGLADYRFLFEQDQQVWPAVRNTLWLMAFAVPLQVLFAFGVALMLTRARRGVGFFRTVFYLPALAPPVAATLGFVYLLNPAT